MTVTERQAEFPAASWARSTTVLVPTSKGTSPVFQLDVPVATPELPKEVDHVTRVTPTLSAAVP